VETWIKQLYVFELRWCWRWTHRWWSTTTASAGLSRVASRARNFDSDSDIDASLPTLKFIDSTMVRLQAST
jgi:hypothetical protein